MDFASLKKNRKNELDKLTSELNKMAAGGGGRSNDDRFWQPEVDKAGNGYAVIRFLPGAPGEEGTSFVRLWDHGFQGPTGLWYIENSLTTLGLEDPVAEYNGRLWNSGIESDKEIVRKQKRRLHFISNIYVVNDPAKPENNGKVFLFKYGKKIFDKINDLMNPNPADPDAVKVNPFDLWEGANFKLKIRKVEGYRNYDKSEFGPVGPLSADDEELEAIWKQQHSLKKFLDPSNFKSYDELKAKFERVINATPTDRSMAAGGGSGSRSESYEDDDIPFDDGQAGKAQAAPELPKSSSKWEDDEDELAFFKKLTDN